MEDYNNKKLLIIGATDETRSLVIAAKRMGIITKESNLDR